LKLEEEEKQRKLEEEKKLNAEKELEEARLKAKRDRERKLKEDEDNEELSFDAFGLTGPGPLLGINISNEVVSGLRSSLKMTSTASEPPRIQEHDA